MATYQGTFEDSNGNVLLNTPHSYAYIESGTTATRSYAKGDLLVFKNQLCQANAAISTGATLTIGGNVLATSVANQLSNINVYVDENENKLHFVDHAGADTVLPFSSGKDTVTMFFAGNYTGWALYYKDATQSRNVYVRAGSSVNDIPDVGSDWPKISCSKITQNSTWTYTITIKSAGYYWIPNSLNGGRGSWQYKNTNDQVTLTGGIKDSSGMLIQYHSDLSEDR